MNGKITLQLIVVLVFLTSCERMTAPGQQKQFENKTYVRLFYSSEKECLEDQEPDFFINCHQQLDFFDKNRVEIMLSDVIWIGTYKVIGKKLIIQMEPNFEIPTGLVAFDILNNNVLRRVGDGSIWKKLKGKSIWK